MFGLFKRTAPASTPAGQIHLLYENMSEQTHLLIAGETGSGKSVVINGILSTLMYRFPHEAQLILIDPKRVELVQWKNTPHCIRYASEPGEPAQALKYALELTEERFKKMQQRSIRKYDGGHIYVIIDELADLMTTDRYNVVPLLQRLCQIGRAANIQCPLAKIIPTEIKVNFDSILGLRTATRQHSRNIIELNGCECLPKYGRGYYRTPANGLSLETIPMVEESEIQRLIDHWKAQRTRTA